MACVEVPALHFGLDVAARHTLADNARFHITIAPAQGWCLSCNQPSPLKHPHSVVPFVIQAKCR